MEKFLPVGVQNFEEMIKGNFVYVDKTRYIYDMVRIPQAFYFLSRPRRFGKSLLVSTLKALFEGKKELFKGLWIEKADWQWKKHPVVLIDFSGITLDSTESLRIGIQKRLAQIASNYGIDFKENFIKEGFKEVILNLYKKYQVNVVVLVDEYDKPMIEHLGFSSERLEIAKDNRDLLKQFYGVLKDADVSAVLRFVFFTGISKFSKVSIFSDLNNLKDLSMNAYYAPFLGYTAPELESFFHDRIQQLAQSLSKSYEETMKILEEWYNGYRFTSRNVTVYNPFSILNVLTDFELKSYWFETATPSFLVNLIKEKQYRIPAIEFLELNRENFSVYDIDNLKLEPLLFQTGYLTIKAYQDELYRLSYPNQEVKISFLSYIYDQLVDLADSSQKVQYKRLQHYLRDEAIDKFIETVNSILSSIPYPHIQKQNEHYYHTVFYLMLSASGVMVHTEVLSAWGQVDIEVHFEDKVYIIELKCNQAAEKAIAQIRSKRYHEKYLQGKRKIILMGINFSTEERRITDWKLERVNHSELQ